MVFYNVEAFLSEEKYWEWFCNKGRLILVRVPYMFFLFDYFEIETRGKDVILHFEFIYFEMNYYVQIFRHSVWVIVSSMMKDFSFYEKLNNLCLLRSFILSNSSKAGFVIIICDLDIQRLRKGVLPQKILFNEQLSLNIFLTFFSSFLSKMFNAKLNISSCINRVIDWTEPITTSSLFSIPSTKDRLTLADLIFIFKIIKGPIYNPRASRWIGFNVCPKPLRSILYHTSVIDYVLVHSTNLINSHLTARSCKLFSQQNLSSSSLSIARILFYFFSFISPNKIISPSFIRPRIN